MKKLNILFLLFLTILIHLNVFGQEVTSSFIDEVVERSMKSMTQAGVAVAVVKDGKVIHSKGYGLASLKTNKKADENTLFAIASNSKAFTTTALGMLVDEGKLNWTDKVVDYIPEFKMYDPYVTKSFTITDLITHRSGLGLGAGDLMFIPDGSDFTVSDIVTSFQYQKPVSEFRTKYDYDNLLYIVAGEVIKRVSGLPWDTYVEQKIMKPLGMDRSGGYYGNIAGNKNIAQPHEFKDGKLTELNTYEDPNKVFGAAGGIYASVNDLTKWMQMHLDDGKYGEDKILISNKNHQETWKAHTNLYFNASPKGTYKNHYRAYGLGWFLKDENGYTIISHTGGMPGMLSQTVLIPELNAGIVVLTNCAPGGYSFISVANEIKDELIGIEGQDWVASAKSWIEASNSEADSVVNAVWNTVKKANTKNLQQDNYVGTYEDGWFGQIVIEKKEGKLWFSSKRSPRLNGEMFFYQANTFVVKWEYTEMNCDAFAMFSLDENGKAQSIKMKGVSPDIDFSFDFHDLDLKRLD